MDILNNLFKWYQDGENSINSINNIDDDDLESNKKRKAKKNIKDDSDCNKMINRIRQNNNICTILSVIGEIDSKYTKIKEKNINLDLLFTKHINLDYEKKDISDRAQKKLQKMEERRKLVSLKYDHYKRNFDRGNMTILILSLLLTFLEGLRAELSDDRMSSKTKLAFNLSDDGMSSKTKLAFNLIPLIISVLISFIASLLKFKRYQEKIESMIRSIEKCIYTAFRIKKFQEGIYFINKYNEFHDACNVYREEIYNLYNQSQAELEHNLKYRDRIKYSKELNNLTIKSHQNIATALKNDTNNNINSDMADIMKTVDNMDDTFENIEDEKFKINNNISQANVLRNSFSVASLKIIRKI